MKNINKKILSAFTLWAFVAIPFVSHAKRLITCGAVDGNAETGGPCNFNELIATANNIIEFLLIYFATPLAAIIFAYAGFLYLFSGGSENNVTKAKGMMKNMIIGYVIALSAWLIVRTILMSLGYNGTMFI